MRSEAIRSVIRAYDDPMVRAYCWGRFWILRQRFLDEIGQYLPTRGRVLDLGCGFGLFSLYYASVHPTLAVEGFDRNARRIGMARAAAARLHLGNVRYEVGDVMDFRGGERFDAARGLEVGLVNHLTPAAGLDAKVSERVGELLKGAPQAQARIKELFVRWTESGWEEYRASLPETLARVRSGAEAKDGLAAFFEKRKPGWVP